MWLHNVGLGIWLSSNLPCSVDSQIPTGEEVYHLLYIQNKIEAYLRIARLKCIQLYLVNGATKISIREGALSFDRRKNE